MAIVQAILALISRSLGSILSSLFGWAVVALFGFAPLLGGRGNRTAQLSTPSRSRLTSTTCRRIARSWGGP